MNEDVKVVFNMKMSHNRDEHVVEFESSGKRYKKKEATFLLFNEPVAENKAFNRVTCILYPQHLTIIRKGLTEMNQKFSLNDVTIGFFQNQYGKIETKVLTKDYQYKDDVMTLTYDMLSDGVVVGKYELNIQIKGVV